MHDRWVDKLSPRDCVDLLFARERYIHNCVNHKPNARWLAMCSGVFLLLLEMRDLNKLKSKLEIITETKMLDTCQHKFVL